MADKFHISVDETNRVLRIRLCGFWSLNEAVSFRGSLTEAMDSLGTAEPWNVIADVRMFPIQPKPVQNIHMGLMRRALQTGMVKSASIVGGPLTRIQIEELSGNAWPERGHFESFLNETDAEAWLSEVNSGIPESASEILQVF